MNLQSENINELITALSKAQGEIKPAMKNSMNPHFKNKYADLSEVWEACREPLSKHNLAVIQTTAKDEQGSVCLITTLAHSSGQWMKSEYPIVCRDPSNPQSWGSALTYARRYNLSSIVGIAPDEDDDGNKAANHDKKIDKPKMTTNSQWVELNQLSEQCDDEYQKNMWDYLASQDILSFEKMDEKTFLKLKKGCLGNIEKQKKIHAIG